MISCSEGLRCVSGAERIGAAASRQDYRTLPRRGFPFATRAEFVEAIDAGGVAAMEVLARDLKALGLYAARSLSYEGIEYAVIVARFHTCSK